MSSEINKVYKYSTKISAFARAVPEVRNKSKLATASLKNLAGVFEDDIQEKIQENPDLLYVASNLILLNYANYNHDCILRSEILPVYEKFEDKWLDIEHDRKIIVGMISEVGFSLYPTNDVIDIEDFDENFEENPEVLDQDWQLVIGGFIWRVINNRLCERIEEASIESSKIYGSISTSFEIMFNDYDIAVGENGERNAKKCKIIKAGDPEWAKYDRLLPSNGGSGYDGNSIVFRVLRDIWPAGAGIVAQPASGLKGILAINESVISEDETEDTEVEQPENETEDAKCGNDKPTDATQKNDNLEEKIIKSSVSEHNNNNLNQFTQNNMPVEIKSVDDIVTKWSDIAKNEASASEIRSFIANEIVKEGEKFAVQLAEKENLIKTVEANRDVAEKQAAKLAETVATLEAKLAEIENAQKLVVAEQKYNERMSALDEVFDLDSEDRQMLAEEIKNIDSDEAFAVWFDKKKKFNKEKTKAYKAEKKKEMEDKLCKAGVTVEIDETFDFKKILVSASSVSTPISNTVSATESLKDKFSKAFSESVTIGGKKVVEKSEK